jgi:FkbM family methyltransferase
VGKLKGFIKSIINKAGWEVHRYVPRFKEARALLLNQKKIDVVLDVGAFVGGFATELRRGGYAGAIVSFEPVEKAFLTMRRQSDKDPLWETHQLAIGPSAATTTINVGEKIYTSSVLEYAVAYRAVDPELKSTSQEAQMVRLDTWVEKSRWAESKIFLKLDVQGYERECLEGTKGILKNIQMVQIELSLVELYTGSWTLGQALDWLEREGFMLYQMERVFQNLELVRLLQVDGLFIRE